MPVQDSVTESVDCTVDALDVKVAMLGAAGLTVTVTNALVVAPPPPITVSVYVVVDVGLTLVLASLHDTVPTP